MVPTLKEKDYLDLLKSSSSNHEIFNIRKEVEEETPCESQ